MGLKKDKNKEKTTPKDQEKEEKPGAQPEPREPEAPADEKNAQGENGGEREIEEEAIPMLMLPAEDVEHLKAEAKINLENWQRERADFLNYKKRIERDQQQLHARITGEIIKKILPALDDLERALRALPEDTKEASWAEGIDLIYRKLMNIVEAEGVSKIPGETFDPTVHEAITHEESPDHESGEIIEIVQQGYKLGERVLRPALVRVAK